MSCPDIDQALSHALDEDILPAVEAHVRSCAECRSRLRLIREMRAAYSPTDIRVPESLIASAVEAVVSGVAVSPRPAGRTGTAHPPAPT